MNVGGCFDKYISAAIWSPQIKILDSAPGSGLTNFGKVRQSSCAQDKVKHKSIKPDTPWNRVSQTKCKTFFFFKIFLYTFFFFFMEQNARHDLCNGRANVCTNNTSLYILVSFKFISM